MKNYDQDALDALLRGNLRAFVEKTFSETTGGEPFHDNWHIGAITEALTDVARGNTKRLLITQPPRSLKSTITSVALPAWILGWDPTRKIIAASYSQELAAKFSIDTRTVMRSTWYRRAFPGTALSKEKQTELQLHTTQHGYRYASSVGGSLTGMGASLILVDDPIKADEGATSAAARQAVKDWFSNTLYSRLNNKSTDPLVVTMQRTHVDDLAGFLHELGGWTLLSIPAEAHTTLYYRFGPGPDDIHRFKAGDVLQPDREPKAVLEETRRNIGTRAYQAQYLQEPAPDSGNLFDWRWFTFFDLADVPKLDFDFVFQVWDVASSVSDTADYSVCTTWGVIGLDRYYLIDVERVRLPQPALIELAKNIFNRHAPDAVLIESTGVGAGFYQQMRLALGSRILAVTAKGDKVVRAEAQTPLIEQGRVCVPREAVWLNAFRNEIIAFPGAKYDDQVDSMAHFLKCVPDLINRANLFGRLRQTGRDVRPSLNQPEVKVTLLAHCNY